jgi:hypothetical protein
VFDLPFLFGKRLKQHNAFAFVTFGHPKSTQEARR